MDKPSPRSTPAPALSPQSPTGGSEEGGASDNRESVVDLTATANDGADQQSVMSSRPTKAMMDTEITEITRAPVPPAPAGGIPSTSWKAGELQILTLGDYRLIKKLGEGAMGAVYKAQDISSGQEVALKVMFPHLVNNPKAVERFDREAQIMGLLDHPHLIEAYAVGEDQG